MRIRSPLISMSSPPAMLSRMREEGSFSPRSISARYETETCAPSATCLKVSPRSLRTPLSVSPVAESRSLLLRLGRISTVFMREILYPSSAQRQPARQPFEETDLLGVHLRRRVRCLHHRRNPV